MDKQGIDRRLRQVLPRRAYDTVRLTVRRAQRVAGVSPGAGRVLPDFLIIGSTKCGTTSLHGWLTEHPMVAGTKKEIHFFNMNWHRGTDWYRAYFPHKREVERFANENGRPLTVGEATASYLAHYWTPQRMHKLLPNAKLIVILRDPVDRAHSQYHYFVRRGTEPAETFEEALELEAERLAGEEQQEIDDPRFHSWRVFRWGYQRTSRYAEHLERWLAVYPREQFLFLSFERDIAGDPEGTLARVQEFLGLPPHKPSMEKLNAGSYKALSDETRDRLNDYFAPHNRRLYELTGIDFGWPS